jgi:hypothetical protein
MLNGFKPNLDDASLDAMLIRAGYAPDRFLSRKDTEKLFAAFGIGLRAGTMARFASTRDDGPPYQIIFGRALMQPRESLRWAFSRASLIRRSPPPEDRQPRMKPDKRSDKPSRRKSQRGRSTGPTRNDW